MRTEDMALVQGWEDTRATLRAWFERPGPVLAAWARGSLAVAVMLLLATWGVATLTDPDPTRVEFPGVFRPADIGDYLFVLFRNSLVLTLHALACVAGFMAGSSLPQVAQGYTGVVRWIHEKAGPLAIAFVVAATVFSLVTQAYALGGGAATMAAQMGLSEWELMLGLLPHALPELFALFLPLAAWTIAAKRGSWEQLLAATFVTTAIAVPILLVSGMIEVWVSPHVLRGLAGI